MKEINYLWELAKRYLEYANLPVMHEREQLWYRHAVLQNLRWVNKKSNCYIPPENIVALVDAFHTLSCEKEKSL